LYYHHKTQKGEKTRILEYSLSIGGPKTKNKKNQKKPKKKKQTNKMRNSYATKQFTKHYIFKSKKIILKNRIKK
jgi:hypothetical protein